MLKTTFSISAILGLLALSACAPQNTVRRTGNSGEEALKTRAITLYTEGQLAAMSGDFANALRYYYRAYLLDTTNAVILNSIGRTHLQADNYKSAELYLRKAVVLDNRDVENWTALGEAYLGMQQYPQAADAFARAVALKPRNMGIRRSLMFVYSQMGDREKLLQQYTEILNTIGFDPQIALQRAELLLSLDRPAEAREMYFLLVSMDGSNTDAILGLAAVDLSQGDTTSAKIHFQRALSMQPGNDKAEFLYTRLLRQERDWDTLIAYFNQRVAADSSDNRSRINLAEAYFWREDFDSAKVYLLPYYDIDGLLPGIQHLIGKTETRLENYPTAEDYLRRALTAQPDEASIYFDLAYCLDEAGKYQAAADILGVAAGLFPEQTLFHKYQAQVLLEAEAYGAAIAALNKALAAEPDDLVSLSILASLYAETQQHALADSVYQKALVIDAKNATILNNYAYGLAERDTLLIRAHKMATEAVRQEPNNPSFLDTIAWILYKLGRVDEAQPYMQRALDASTDEPSFELYYHAGIIFRYSDPQKALHYLRLALELEPENEAARRALSEEISEKP
jgi:tetratricopeptide (TPR) repeat protein